MFELTFLSRKTFLPVLLCLALLIGGCGLKVWPEPQAQNDTFAWGNITYTSHGTCLEINGLLTGAYENLAKIELEIAYTDADCPSCPFQSEKTAVFTMDTPELSRNKGAITIVYCQLPDSASFRWRLVAHNVHSLLQDVHSPVFMVGE